MSRIAAVALMVGISSLAGCKHREPPRARQQSNEHATDPEHAVVEEPEPELKPEPAPSPRFWVADGGVRAYDLDGRKLATLAEQGDHARRLADGRMVVLVEGDDARSSLIVLSPTGEPGVAVVLPNAVDLDTCSGKLVSADDHALPLELQSPEDFYLNEAGTHACLNTMDRNLNMASDALMLSVELATGKLDARVYFDMDERCPQPQRQPACTYLRTKPWVEGASASDGPPASWPVSYDPETGVLRREGRPITKLCPPTQQRGEDFEPSWVCARLEQASSSGRWVLVSGTVSEGDYIHRDLYLLDRQTAALHTIACDDQRACKLRKIAPAQLWTGELEALDVVGESEIAALPNDRLWVDGLLLIPERGEVVNIGGSLVLTGI